jgi:protein TonB
MFEQSVTGPARHPNRVVSMSLAFHGLLLALLLGVFGHRARLVPYRLPGTAQGTRLLTYYAPGSPHSASAEVAVKPQMAPAPSLVHALPAPKPQPAPATPAEHGSGDAAESGSGEGDIAIALQKFFPYPAVDLSGLPDHASGDVILNAVIDPDGKVADLTLLHGLGDPIDSTVIATVKQWTYTPARKNGVPVASEQELHFHFERG